MQDARLLPLAAALVLGLGAPSWASGPVPFGTGWQEQTFPRLDANRYDHRGSVLKLRSEQSVSMTWRALPRDFHDARQAAWRWQVNEGTPATDLTRKGGDDRNIALYFLFLPQDKIARGGASSIRRLLSDRDARVLIYVWGGAHERNEVLPSPYLGARGKTVVLRGAGTGAHSERVDLAADHARAFGAAPQALVGVAVSADSDDTESRIIARLEGLELR
jgi:hypothetical protein